MHRKILAYFTIFLVIIAIQGSIGIGLSLEKHFGIQGANKKVVCNKDVEEVRKWLEASKETQYIYYSQNETVIESKYGDIDAVLYGVQGNLSDFYYLRLLEGKYLIEANEILISSGLVQELKEDGQVGKILIIEDIPFKIVGIIDEEIHNAYTTYGILSNQAVYAVETIGDIESATFNYEDVGQLTTFTANILVFLISMILVVEIVSIQIHILKRDWIFFNLQRQSIYLRELVKKYQMRLLWHIIQLVLLVMIQVCLVGITRKDISFSVGLIESIQVGKGFTIMGTGVITSIYILQLSFILTGILSVVYLAMIVFCNQLKVGVAGTLMSICVAYSFLYLLGLEICYSTTLPVIILLGISLTQRIKSI